LTKFTNRQYISAWYHATRPRVFTATYAPMGVAAAVAIQDGVFEILPFTLALIGVLFLQTAANLVNEYFDYVRGADKLKEAGQGMSIKRQELSSREVLIGAIFTVLAGSLIGLYLLAQSGPLLWVLGIAGVLITITYTAGPFPLAYNGLGEIAVGIAMGPMIIVGAYYVMDTDIYPELILISVPIAFMVAAILHANNIRDMEADRAVNKNTLAIILGLRFARVEYAFLVGGTYVALLLLIIFGQVPPATLLAMVTIRQAYQLIHTFYTQTDTQSLHRAQGLTAKLHGQFALTMVVGWLLWLAIGG
jgi:1,4-dihydroxy-2-naphthoate polyprenyltransferase